MISSFWTLCPKQSIVIYRFVSLMSGWKGQVFRLYLSSSMTNHYVASWLCLLWLSLYFGRKYTYSSFVYPMHGYPKLGVPRAVEDPPHLATFKSQSLIMWRKSHSADKVHGYQILTPAGTPLCPHLALSPPTIKASGDISKMNVGLEWWMKAGRPIWYEYAKQRSGCWRGRRDRWAIYRNV